MNDSTCPSQSVELIDPGSDSSLSLCIQPGEGYSYVSVGTVLTVIFHIDSSLAEQNVSLLYEAIGG